MSSTPQSREELLASINSLSKKTLVCLESGPGTSRSTANDNPNVPLESIHVTKPPPLLSRLLEAGAPQHIAQEMHTIYLDHAKKLKTQYTAVISRLRKDLPRLPTNSVDTFNDQLVPFLLRMYTKALEDWMHDGVDMFRTQQPPHKKPFNQTFNHDYVPLLEHFFDENPFPTHAEKAFLARKSCMSYQQIHVWFQNRRSRSRKVGKVLRKKPMPEGTARALDSSRVCLDKCVTKSGETVVGVSCREKSENSDPLCQSFDQCAVTGPSCSTQTELKFDPNWWPRRPSLAKPRQASCDMDDLVEKLSRLSVRDRTSGRGKKHQDELRYPLTATSSITVIPLLAPHPALIHRRNVLSPPLPPLVVPRTSASRTTRLRAFNPSNSSPSLNPLASSGSGAPDSLRERRKVMSKDSFLGVISSEKCEGTSSRALHTTSHSISTLSANTIDHVPRRNCGPRDSPLAPLSQHVIPSWNFRCAVTV